MDNDNELQEALEALKNVADANDFGEFLNDDMQSVFFGSPQADAILAHIEARRRELGL